MTDNNIQPNRYTLLRNILRLIAQNPDLERVAPSILGEARVLTRANGGFYLIFDEPRILFVDLIDDSLMPSDEILREVAQGLSQEIHIGSQIPQPLARNFAGWVIIPVYQRETAIGIFCLVFREELDLSEETTDMLMALVDGLATVTQSTKASERHAKLTRNQYEFVRIVSHDLRSPLTSIKGFAGIIEGMMESADIDPVLQGRVIHGAEKIVSGVAQMTALVENIQDAGRYDPETGFYEMQRSPTDLIDIIHKISKNHLMPAEKEALTLKVTASDDIPIVNVDANMLERSITNLVDNAIKYTPNGGIIEVGIHRDNDDIVITVSDDGFGISEENLKSLFMRHTRIRRREHKTVKGSGLGLFIVRSVARHHGGDAFVESEVGNGSTFGIRIPLQGENLLGSSIATETD
ncbi:MAG: GAF domain-containing sensor histidine kinase [Anaerolineae bacterium]|nr:GAF domain-containing sensor histidine kinase [Anaerolineae bacterium]MDQ7034419.1 GAF domain-containing sensor histidine kinase [Anaerolineae bacterium]